MERQRNSLRLLLPVSREHQADGHFIIQQGDETHSVPKPLRAVSRLNGTWHNTVVVF